MLPVRLTGPPCRLARVGAWLKIRARIGTGSLVGAKALVLERAVFPPNSLILGSPAKAVRQLTPEQVEEIRHSAAHYRDNGRDFRNGLSEVAG